MKRPITGFPKTRAEWLHLLFVVLFTTDAGMLLKEILGTDAYHPFVEAYNYVLLFVALALFLVSIRIAPRSGLLADFGLLCSILTLAFFLVPVM